MGRIYTVQFSDVAVTALQDLFELTAPSDAIVHVHGWELIQTSDVGDAQEEIVRIETVRGVGSVTSGTGGSVPTPQPLSDGDPAFGGVTDANNTTRMAAGSGSLEVLEQYGWNVRIPWSHYFTPELRPCVSPSNRWTLALPAAPTDSLTVSGTLRFEEVGG